MKRSIFAAQESFFDRSKVCFTANSKLARWAQTAEFAAVPLTKNGARKNLPFALRSPFLSRSVE
jgi:hypothetical protein